MADGAATSLLIAYGPDIAKALTAGVMGLSVYVWNQREKSIDAIETDLANDRKVNEDRLTEVYKKINETTAARDLKHDATDRKVAHIDSALAGHMGKCDGRHGPR